MSDNGIDGGCHISWIDGFIDRIWCENDRVKIQGDFMLGHEHPRYSPQPDGFWACYCQGWLIIEGVGELKFFTDFGRSKGGVREIAFCLPAEWHEERAPSLLGANLASGRFSMSFDGIIMKCAATRARLELGEISKC